MPAPRRRAGERRGDGAPAAAGASRPEMPRRRGPHAADAGAGEGPHWLAHRRADGPDASAQGCRALERHELQEVAERFILSAIR